MRLVARAIAAWCLLLVLMFTNGTLRVVVLQPRLGEDRARQLASLTGFAIVLALAWVFVRLTPQARQRQLLRVGAIWLVLTLAFELLFGRFASGQTWTALLADYNVLRGRLWPLVLLGTVAAPWVWGRILRRPA